MAIGRFLTILTISSSCCLSSGCALLQKLQSGSDKTCYSMQWQKQPASASVADRRGREGVVDALKYAGFTISEGVGGRLIAESNHNPDNSFWGPRVELSLAETGSGIEISIDRMTIRKPYTYGGAQPDSWCEERPADSEAATIKKQLQAALGHNWPGRDPQWGQWREWSLLCGRQPAAANNSRQLPVSGR